MNQTKSTLHASGSIGGGAALAGFLLFLWKVNFPESYAAMGDYEKLCFSTLVILGASRGWSVVSARLDTDPATLRTPWWVVILLLPLWLGGCASYRDVPIDDTRDAILVANAELRGANFLLQDLIRSDAIARDDAQKALDHLRQVHQALATALVAVDLHGDAATAETQLDQALVALDLALSLLAPHTAPPQAAVTSELREAA